MRKETQLSVIIKAMLENKNKTWWTAKDFQKEPYFVGYEASARMSDLKRLYPEAFIVGKEGRFRTLSINWDNTDEIKQFVNRKLKGAIC